MRRIIPKLVIATALVWVLPTNALAVPGDSSMGAGRMTIGASTGDFRFSARSGPLGEDPSGRMFIEFPGIGQVEAEVTCLAVVGTDSTIIGDVTKTDFEGVESIAFLANDNRTLGMPDSFDWILMSEGTSVQPCAPEPSLHAIERGNIVVRDN